MSKPEFVYRGVRISKYCGLLYLEPDGFGVKGVARRSTGDRGGDDQ